MTAKTLQDLLTEVETVLRDSATSAKDRTVLDNVRTELKAALTSVTTQPPAPAEAPTLRSQLQEAVENLEREHPRLTSLLARTLDLLSDVGV
jgi:ElaB/YqjD/DUF883 family membrane-anchored ribosome-binding protein